MKTECKLAVVLVAGVVAFCGQVSAADLVMPSASPNIALASSAPSSEVSQEKSLDKLEEKVTDGLKASVKQLSDTSTITLEDMNSARQAVAKLEILIEIEKKLADLDKIKGERSGVKTSVPAIAASALSAPPKPVAFAPGGDLGMMGDAGMMQPMPAFGPMRGEVTRIVGANGRYMAVMQGKNVQVGDKLSDGSVVSSISANAVTIREKNGKTNTLKVQGVQQVQRETF